MVKDKKKELKKILILQEEGDLKNAGYESPEGIIEAERLKKFSWIEMGLCLLTVFHSVAMGPVS